MIPSKPARVFVLCTGRCGSVTFARACEHLSGYTVGHETQAGFREGRVDYPPEHIEVDHRLSWFLGLLDQQYGDDPVYVHLTRDKEAVIASWAKRYGDGAGLMYAFAHGVMFPSAGGKPAARLMVEAATANIEAFLRDKSKVVRVRIEEPWESFGQLCALLHENLPMEARHDLAQVTNSST